MLALTLFGYPYVVHLVPGNLYPLLLCFMLTAHVYVIQFHGDMYKTDRTYMLLVIRCARAVPCRGVASLTPA